MATSIKRSPYNAPKSSKAYRLEMEGRTLFLLVGLSGLTGLVIFALGVATGMGMREPVRTVPVATVGQPVPSAGEKSTETPAEKLAFSTGVKNKDKTVEGLTLTQQQEATQTRNLVNKAEKELKLEEVPAVSSVEKPKTQPVIEPEAPKAQQPTPAQQPTVPPPAQIDRYTVQVFSSQQKDNAQELQAKLKKLGFPAFLNQFQGPNKKVWYRVRVGNTSKSDAEQLAKDLSVRAGLKAPQVIRQ